MQNIEQEVTQNFLQNLEFLQVNHPNLYKKIQDFEQKGVERYALEYRDEGYFDVQELQSSHFLYGENSTEVSSKIADQINFKTDSFAFEGMPLYYRAEKQKHDDKTIAHVGLYPIMSYYIDHFEDEKKMKKIEKFIFIGVGLGLHIPLLVEKLDPEYMIVIEDDLELFRLSLFTTPYYKIFQNKKVIFSVASSQLEFSQEFREFLDESFYLNRTLKYVYFPAHSEQKIRDIKSLLASQNFITFGYNIMLSKYLKPFEFMQEHYKVLNLKNKLNLPVFEDKPILLIGAGPSLQEHIEWLKEHQDEFIIFSVATALRLLHKHNIKPDIISHIDGFAEGFANFEGFEIQEFVKESIVLLGSFVEQRVRELFTKELTYMMEEDTFYFTDFSSPTAPCIGSTNLANALILGAKELYLLGLDLSLGRDGATHAQGHNNAAKRYTLDSEDQTLSQKISLRDDLLSVEGNRGEKVHTTPLFYSSINSINNSIKALADRSTTIYNLSNGAKFHHTQARDTTTLSNPTIDKSAFRVQLCDALDALCRTELSKEELASLTKRLDFAKTSLQKIKQYEKKQTFHDPKEYMYNLYGLMMELYPQTNRENRNLMSVFDTFFQYCVPIIYDMVNTKKERKALLQDLKRVDLYLVKELKRIAKTYSQSIEGYLKEVA